MNESCKRIEPENMTNWLLLKPEIAFPRQSRGQEVRSWVSRQRPRFYASVSMRIVRQPTKEFEQLLNIFSIDGDSIAHQWHHRVGADFHERSVSRLLSTPPKKEVYVPKVRRYAWIRPSVAIVTVVTYHTYSAHQWHHKRACPSTPPTKKEVSRSTCTSSQWEWNGVWEQQWNFVRHSKYRVRGCRTPAPISGIIRHTTPA